MLTGESGLMVDLVGDSTGGGMVETVTLDGFPYRTLGDAFVLLVQDPQEALSSEKLERLRAELPEVVDAQTVRVAGRGVLHAFALPVEPDLTSLREVLGGGAPVLRLALLRPLLPVVSQIDRKPQLFDTMTRWRELAAEHDVPLWEVAVQYEMDASGWPFGWVVDRMRELSLVMRRQTRAVYEEDVAVIDSRVQAGLRRPLDEARGDAGRASATASRRRRSSTRTAPAPVCPASRTCPGPWAAAPATSTPPSAPCRRPAA